MADSDTISILLSTFSGLGLPSTLCIPISRNSSISTACSTIISRLPPSAQTSRFLITTTSNQQLNPSSPIQISTLLDPANGGGKVSHPQASSFPQHHASPSAILPLRLSVPLCGGKGGFGSQLRAAGGRMSSRKKRSNNPQEAHASSRNLDGRRLRTVTEAKALAEYLAVKPEMDRREKEERRKRWEQVVEQAELREAELRSGKKGRVDGAWVESKEETSERTREAVRRAMLEMAEEDAEESEEGSEVDDGEEEEAGPSSAGTTPPEIEGKGQGKALFGWDEDDEFMSSDEEEHEEVKGKGKGKAAT